MDKYKNVFNKIKTILNGETNEVVETTDEAVEVVKEVEVTLGSSEVEGGGTIFYDGTLGLDTLIFTDETLETPASDGDIILINGDALTIEAGVVTKYTPAEVEETPVVEEVPEEEALSEDFELKYNELLEVIAEMKGRLEKFNKTEKSLKLEIEKLSIEPEVESVSQKPMEVRPLSQVEQKLETLEAIRRLQR